MEKNIQSDNLYHNIPKLTLDINFINTKSITLLNNMVAKTPKGVTPKKHLKE